MTGEKRDAAPTFILIHSPLVGPMTWAPVASELRARGARAIAPSLAGAVAAGPPFVPRIAAAVAHAVTSAAAGGAPDDQPLLVAHSGAGPLLPAIRATLYAMVGGYVFVDAGLPHDGRSYREMAPPAFAALLASMTKDGLLPPWSQWWGAGVMRALIPDGALRARFEADCRPVPSALFEEPLPMPAGWPDAPCAFLRLSAAYDDAIAEARRRGWASRSIDGSHLQMLADPAVVAEALLQLAGQLTTAD